MQTSAELKKELEGKEYIGGESRPELAQDLRQKLAEKEREIERITELLKKQFAVKFNTPMIKLVADEQGLTPDEFFNKCWDIYKKEHNLQEFHG